MEIPEGHIPEDRRGDDRRRRTERQRQKRAGDRVCGMCQRPADGGLQEWETKSTNRRPLLLPICRGCQARLYGEWQNLDHFGFSCPLEVGRPCSECMREDRPQERPVDDPYAFEPRPQRFGRRIQH